VKNSDTRIVTRDTYTKKLRAAWRRACRLAARCRSHGILALAANCDAVARDLLAAARGADLGEDLLDLANHALKETEAALPAFKADRLRKLARAPAPRPRPAPRAAARPPRPRPRSSRAPRPVGPARTAGTARTAPTPPPPAPRPRPHHGRRDGASGRGRPEQ